MKPGIIVILVLLIVFSGSCRWKSDNEYNLEKQIGEYIKIQCRGKVECRIRLNQVTPFQWDKFYFFDFAKEGYRIVEITGISADYDENMKRKFIFVKNNRIVYLEENESDIESAIEGEVWFVDASRKNYAVFDSNAEFRAVESGHAFSVECLNCDKTQ